MTHGFRLIKEQTLHEVNGTARLWKHETTGAELLSIVNTDENKCFGVTFRTPPADSTGVAHILEHSVLCGSEKYPVKEPFVELLKGSLQTFLNAFTFPDKTCYPVASANLQDFYNLMDVYIDAVFHPRINEDIFRQEGWHIDVPTPDAPWTYKGVVYNEMKGAYSSPDSVLAEQSQQSLFPNMLYSLDSGGNPEHIPDLTYADFVQFHKLYYHPSNARFFFWGDDPEDERLRRIAEALEGYEACAVPSEIPLQPRLSTARQIEVPYAASKEETRAHLTVNWLLDERANIELAITMEMLEHILEGMPGSPLRRTLIASGLGEDVTGCGLETDLRQMYYSTGLKGVHPRDIAKAELLIFDTLAGLVEEGFDPTLVEAAVNSIEFAYREANSGRFPRGLAAMIQALSTWLYDGDPFAALAWEAPLSRIKERLARGEKVFENAIRTWFLDNPHRSTVILLPDTTLTTRREEKEQQRLQACFDASSDEERAALHTITCHLQDVQGTPDSPEALATIPNVGLADLPRETTEFPLRETKDAAKEITWLEHELPTRGITYTSLLFPLDAVPDALIPLLPIFGRSLTEFGTSQKDFTELGATIAAKTGGIGADAGFSTTMTGETVRRFIIGAKVVDDKLPALYEILHEILLSPMTDDALRIERLRQMLLEEKSRLEHGLVAAGHMAVSSRLRAQSSASAALSERCSALSYLQSIRQYIQQVEHDPTALLHDLETLRRCILASQGVIVDTTAEAPALKTLHSLSSDLLAALPSARPAHVAVPSRAQFAKAEAIVSESQVNYVGKGANIYDLGYTYHGSINVILRALRMGYLWERVRVQGGAYGSFCTLDRMSGSLVFASYRDPNITETLAVYDEVAQYLRHAAAEGEQLERAIVGAIGDLDTYLLPDAKGATALARWTAGEGAEDRARMREEMFATTAKDFHNFADIMQLVAEKGATCVLGGTKARAVAAEQGWTTVALMEP